MKRLKYIIYSLIPVILLQSCLYEDKGNYDYNYLPEIKISGIEEKGYGTKIIFKDSLIIHPTITFGDEDASAFNCKWYRKERDHLVLVSEKPELDLALNVNGHNYYIFEAIHKKYGVLKHIETSCLVQSLTETGWYILKENSDGNTELDGWYRKDGTGAFEVTDNLLESKLGTSLEGKPVDLNYYNHLTEIQTDSTPTLTLQKSLRICSENDMVVFNVERFDCVARFDDLFFDPIPVEERKINKVISYADIACLITNGGDVRACPMTKSATFFSKYFSDQNGKKEIKMSTNVTMPYTLIGPNASGLVYGYNEKTSSYVMVGGTVTSLMRAPISIGFTDPNGISENLNAAMLYFGSSKQKEGVSILKKHTDKDSLIVVQHLFNNIQFISKMDTLYKKTNFGIADFITADQEIYYIYYSVNSKLYSYNIVGKSELEMTAKFESSDEVITYMKFLKLDYDKDYKDKIGLYIGTYKDGKYKLYRFPMQAGSIANADPEIIVRGEGKLKSIVYTGSNANVAGLYIYL